MTSPDLSGIFPRIVGRRPAPEPTASGAPPADGADTAPRRGPTLSRAGMRGGSEAAVDIRPSGSLGKAKAELRPGNIEMSVDLHDQLQVIVSGWVIRHYDALIEDPDVLNHKPLANSILENLTRPDVMTDGVLDHDKLQARVEAYLRTPDAIIEAVGIMEDQLNYLKLAKGWVTSSKHPGERGSPVGTPHTVDTSTGRSFTGRRRGTRDVGPLSPHAAVTVAAGAVGAVVGPIIASSAGSSAGRLAVSLLSSSSGIGSILSTGGGALLSKLLFPGEQAVNFDLSKAALLVLKDPLSPNTLTPEGNYVKLVTGIDVRDVDIDPSTGQIVRSGTRWGESTRTTEAINAEIDGLMSTRSQFYQEQGAENYIDSSPEDFLFAHRGGFAERAEMTGLPWQNKIWKEFNPLGEARPGVPLPEPGFRDIHGHNMRDHPGVFDEDNLDVTGNVIRFMQARDRVRMEIHTRIITREAYIDPLEQVVAQLDARISDTGITREKERRIQASTDKITELATEKTKVEEEQNLSSDLTREQAAVKTIEDDLTTNKTAYGLTLRAGETVAEAIDRTIQENSALIDAGGASGSKHALRELKKRMSTEKVTRRNAHLALMIKAQGGGSSSAGAGGSAETGTTTPMSDLRADANALAEADIDDLYGDNFRELEAAEQRLTILEAKKTEYEGAVKTRTTAETEFVTKAPKTLDEMSEAFTDLVAAVGATITPDHLANQTVDELIVLATAAPYRLPNGTPEEQAALRTMLVRAKTEQKARQAELYNPSPIGQTRIYNGITTALGATISPNDLLSREIGDIHNRLKGPPYNLIDPATINVRAGLAIAEARKRLTSRHKIYAEERLADNDIQTEAQTTIKDNVGEFVDTETKRLRLVHSMLSTQGIGKITEKIHAGCLDRTGAFLSVDDIDNTDMTLTPAERALGPVVGPPPVPGTPRGYLDFINRLTNYQARTATDAMNREEYFQLIYEALPPPVLAQLLHDQLKLGLALADRTNLERVFIDIRRLMGLGTITARNFGPAVRGGITKFGGEMLNWKAA